MADPQPSVVSGALVRPFNEQVAFFRRKLGNLVPTARWDDLQKSAHDQGFMVAGAVKADLLSDLAAAVERANTEGVSLDTFRKDFRAIVAKNGWTGWTGENSAAGQAWRTRIIYRTNTKTAYHAGRLAQLREGNFDLWVYRHNDSVAHPRPLHQSWNGITQPPNSPWWRTHYTPNGWGCECYAVGARTPAAARRVGGDPDKPLPEGWDTIDPKTGEPQGIDKGWGYMPGDSVSDTVRTMAAKTQQWDYTLAKAYMQDVPAAARDALAVSYRGLPSVADDARRYAQRVLAAPKQTDIGPHTLGLLTSGQAAEVGQLVGTDVSLFDWAMDRSSVLHVDAKHGTDAEVARGQAAVTAADYALLPQLLNAPDSVEGVGVARTTREKLIQLRKTMADGRTMVAVFGPRTGRRMMALQSMWMLKAP